jgi:hypothetical protein
MTSSARSLAARGREIAEDYERDDCKEPAELALGALHAEHRQVVVDVVVGTPPRARLPQCCRPPALALDSGAPVRTARPLPAGTLC